MKFFKRSFEKIEPIWKALYSGNTMISPYMDYEFQKIYKKNLWFGSSRVGAKYICYVGYDNDKPVCILPILKKKGKMYIAGDLCATGYLDFIYNDNISQKQFDEIFQFLLGKGTIYLNKINQSSYLYQYLKCKKLDLQKSICVNIEIPEKFDDYYNSLSKHVRQNYRTANNRLKREEKEWKVDVISGLRIDNKGLLDTLAIYNKREEERNNKKVSKIEKYVRYKFNPITKSICNLDNNIYAILYIDGKIAGFLSGLITNIQSVAVIPRLAIDTDYSVYCPGTLLVMKTIKWLIENTNVKHLDLSRGGEKYKYSLGGKEHYNYGVTIYKGAVLSDMD